MSWLTRILRRKPHPPRGIRATLPGGEAVPLTPIYMGRHPLTRIHQWYVQAPDGILADAIDVRLDYLPAHTDLTVVGMVPTSEWSD